MGVLIEQLYAQKKTPARRAAQIAVVVAILVLGTASLIGFRLLLRGFLGTLVGALGTFAVVYFGYKKVLINFDVEFEYTYLDGELDVDRIASKTVRTRLITVNCRNFQQFGVYDAAALEQLSHRQFDCRVDVRSFTAQTVYYAVVKHPKKGLTLLLFEPETRILEDIQKRLRRPGAAR